MNSQWPITWPESVNREEADQTLLSLAEDYAAATMRMLTLYRVGGAPITVMPCGSACRSPLLSNFHPILLTSGAYANCWCGDGCSCGSVNSVTLEAPVGAILEVRIKDAVVDPSTYWVEDGNLLVREDERWPSCAGRDFTVTYLNGYPVDAMGKYAGGILAAEYLKGLRGDKKCRLPSNVTALSRQGVSFELSTGMFPEGTTGITEVDAVLMQWNPHGLRTRPAVHSPDLPKQRQVTWRAP